MIYNDNIDAIVEKAAVEIKGATSLSWLQRIENEYLGYNGIITRSLKSAESLPASVREERKKALEQAKRKLERLINKRTKELKMVQ
jgi:phenylalanyl-tRNA synthetase alpha subunit